MAKIKKSAESKRQKFERIAERRMNAALKVIRLLGNLADRRNYDYSESHVQQILGAVEQEVRVLKSRFRSDGAESSKRFKFSGE
jgi:hypothetical protein